MIKVVLRHLLVLFFALLFHMFAVPDGEFVPDEVDGRRREVPQRVRVHQPKQRCEVQELEQDGHVKKDHGEDAVTDVGKRLPMLK